MTTPAHQIAERVGRIEALTDITDLTRLLEQPEAAMRRIA